MPGIRRGAVLEQIDRLYREGTLAGLGDAELLERYLTHRDEAAFETLVNVHGPMVLGLCRRMLREPKDVEDAFQATFLVLVRKAPAIRDRELLANWLYGVAYRIASRARSDVMRRRGREIAVANLEAPVDAESTDIAEIAPVLDRELNRLPRNYRTALVSCYLGGQTHEQTAKALGCPVGTVRSRIARGRDLLRKRLTRLGYAPSGLFLGPAGGLPARLLTEAVPPALVSVTVNAGLAIGACKTIQAGAVGATVLALTQGALTTMKLTQLKWIGLAVLATTCSAGGVIAVSYASAQVGQGQTAVPASGQDGSVLTEASIERRIDQLLGDIGYFSDNGSIGPDGSFHGTGASRALALKVLERKLGPLLASRRGSVERGGEIAQFKTAINSVGASTTAPGASPSGRDEPAKSKAVGSGTDVTTGPTAGYAHPVSLGAAGQETAVSDPFEVAARSVRQVDIELKLAINNFERAQTLFKRAAISQAELDEQRSKVLRLIGILEGAQEDLADETDRLELERQKKQAELDQVIARRDAAATRVARNGRLNARKPGIVDTSEVESTEAVLREADALVQATSIGVKLAQLRSTQLKRRLILTTQALKLAGPYRAAASR
jgi:RNA polymerase sigma factor (sigma-70 family)